MSLLDKLDRRFGHLAMRNVTLGLIVAQVLVYAISQAQHDGEQLLTESISLIPEKVLAGEVWRLATFLIMPPFTNVLFAFFFWYFFFLMGNALENFWGAFRYNVYLFIGYVATLAAAFVEPALPSSNNFLELSVFLAFAFLNPDFELYLFFIIPVKIKWFALLTWICFFVAVVFGAWLTKALVVASVANFLIFFGKDILQMIRTGRRRMASQAVEFGKSQEPAYHHRCLTCGVTDRVDPKCEFRYCSKCAGNCCYCMEHLRDHVHVGTDALGKEQP